MTTAFNKNDIVSALTDDQGLIKGAFYRVTSVMEHNMPFGNFVTYGVRHVHDEDDADTLFITNGHFLLTDEDPECIRFSG